MKRLWNYISFIGLSDKTKTLENRTIILTNQLNLMIFIAMILLFGITSVMRVLENAPFFIFLFVHISIYYLRNINYNYEKELTEYNEELNSALKKLKETQQQLVHSEKMASLGTLTAGVAHEINNPLNFINGGIHILNELKQELDKYITTDLKKRCEIAIKMVKSGMEKASEIVSSLMTFSNRGTVELVPASINDIIDKTLLFLKPVITSDIILRKEYKLDKEVPVYREKIHQVIMNIVDNAVYAVNKNTDKKDKIIKISTGHVSNKAIIEIINNGPKIPVYDLIQLFDPFFTSKDPGEGTGLGLSISYGLIAEHKGTIRAENRNNEVAFIIKLPML